MYHLADMAEYRAESKMLMAFLQLASGSAVAYNFDSRCRNNNKSEPDPTGVRSARGVEDLRGRRVYVRLLEDPLGV